MKTALILAVLSVALCGCQDNIYGKHFKETPEAAAQGRFAAHAASARIVVVDQAAVVAETRKYEAQGYIVVGYAVFSTDAGDYSASLRQQAEDVKADLVLTSAADAGVKRELVAIEQASAVGQGRSTSSGYVDAQPNGRYQTNDQSSPSQMSNGSAGLSYAMVPQTNYSAVFLRQGAAR
jgi:hypothetical protein